jgi:hypothetical protein
MRIEIVQCSLCDGKVCGKKEAKLCPMLKGMTEKWAKEKHDGA